MDPIVFAVLIGAFILGGAVTAGFLIRNGIRKIMNFIRSNPFLGEYQDPVSALNGISLDYQAEPKSLSDLSTALIPAITRDFPELNIHELISSCEQLLIMTLTSIGDASGASAANRMSSPLTGTKNGTLPLPVTKTFRDTIRRRIADLRNAGKSEHFSEIRIHRTGIRSYEKTAATCRITLQSAIEYFHVIKQNSNVILGSLDVLEQSRYSIQVIYIVDASKVSSEYANAIGVVCPNCGAPVKTLGDKRCAYCQVDLIPIDVRIWRADKITEG
ncbi:MAG: zinc ribbon domain-containing protein [Clostridiales bacterium]|nr:zinc ribbon domain-containing protein [Clostridiales bacterium]